MKNFKSFYVFSIVLTFTIFLAFSVKHDFHTSTTKVELNEGNSSLTFTSKFVTEDLEKAVGVSADDVNGFNAAVESYLKKHFLVKVNNANKNYNYAQAQTSPKATRLYFEIPNVGKINSIEIKNSMLINEFTEQQNFITFNIQGKRDSFVTKKGSEIGKITID